MTEQIYLQVDKKTAAITAATTVPEENPNYDLVKCSEEEFLFLNLLSDTLPDNWSVSLNDLELYRKNKAEGAAKAKSEKVQSLLASSSRVRAKAAAIASVSTVAKSSKTGNNRPAKDKDKAQDKDKSKDNSKDKSKGKSQDEIKEGLKKDIRNLRNRTKQRPRK